MKTSNHEAKPPLCTNNGLFKPAAFVHICYVGPIYILLPKTETQVIHFAFNTGVAGELQALRTRL